MCHLLLSALWRSFHLPHKQKSQAQTFACCHCMWSNIKGSRVIQQRCNVWLELHVVFAQRADTRLDQLKAAGKGWKEGS